MKEKRCTWSGQGTAKCSVKGNQPVHIYCTAAFVQRRHVLTAVCIALVEPTMGTCAEVWLPAVGTQPQFGTHGDWPRQCRRLAIYYTASRWWDFILQACIWKSGGRAAVSNAGSDVWRFQKAGLSAFSGLPMVAPLSHFFVLHLGLLWGLLDLVMTLCRDCFCV